MHYATSHNIYFNHNIYGQDDTFVLTQDMKENTYTWTEIIYTRGTSMVFTIQLFIH